MIFYGNIQIPRISGNFDACADSVYQAPFPHKKGSLGSRPRPFLLALAHCGWLWVHYPLVSSIYINLTLCMVLYIVFIDYIICSCMWITYLSTKSVFFVLRGTSQHSHRFSASTVKVSALRPPKVAPHSPGMSKSSAKTYLRHPCGSMVRG